MLQAIACVGLAILTQKLLEGWPFGPWLLKRQPFSCGYCLTFWWSFAAFNYTLHVYNSAVLALLGLGLASLAGMLAVGLAPWAFYSKP